MVGHQASQFLRYVKRECLPEEFENDWRPTKLLTIDNTGCRATTDAVRHVFFSSLEQVSIENNLFVQASVPFIRQSKCFMSVKVPYNRSLNVPPHQYKTYDHLLES